MRALGIRNLPRGSRGSTRANPANLTAREVDVLHNLALGRTNPEIGEALFCRPRQLSITSPRSSPNSAHPPGARHWPWPENGVFWTNIRVPPPETGGISPMCGATTGPMMQSDRNECDQTQQETTWRDTWLNEPIQIDWKFH